MRVGNEWRDVSIRNVSSRGMMLASDEPPPPGAYLEIRKAMMVVIARAVWARDGFFGIRTQDRVDLDDLLNNAQSRPGDWKPGAAKDRRASDRPRQPSPAERAERSRHRGRVMQFVVVALVAGAMALLIAQEVGELLAVPFAAIRQALGG